MCECFIVKSLVVHRVRELVILLFSIVRVLPYNQLTNHEIQCVMNCGKSAKHIFHMKLFSTLFVTLQNFWMLLLVHPSDVQTYVSILNDRTGLHACDAKNKLRSNKIDIIIWLARSVLIVCCYEPCSVHLRQHDNLLFDCQMVVLRHLKMTPSGQLCKSKRFFRPELQNCGNVLSIITTIVAWKYTEFTYSRTCDIIIRLFVFCRYQHEIHYIMNCAHSKVIKNTYVSTWSWWNYCLWLVKLF